MSGGLNASQIAATVPTVPRAALDAHVEGLNQVIPEFEIDNLPRVHHFLSQIAHESAGFRYLYEIWGPTAAQRGYEGRRDLGNTVRGDGYRYRGRGYMMLTGRANYRAAGKALGLNLEANPDLAARPQIAARIAGWYWTSRNLNYYADRGDAGLKPITYRINGGYNGLADRRAYYYRAKRNITTLDAGGRMSWAKTIIAAAGDKDGRVAAAMYETLAAAGIDADVAREWAIQEAHRACMAEPVGSYDFIVLGGPAKNALPESVHRFVLPWTPDNEKRTDYRNAVGSSYRDTYAIQAPRAMERIRRGLGARYAKNMRDEGYEIADDWEEEEEEVSELQRRIERAFAALRARRGAHYAPWGSGDGWKGPPIYGDRIPTVAETERTGGVCSTALNIACHVNGIIPPGEWKGGTGAWGALANRIGEKFTGPGTILRPGDIVGSPYKGSHLSMQGHVAIVTTPGLPREAKVIQWDAFGGLFGRWNERKGKPGLNELRTVAQTNRLLARPSKWAYIIRREKLFG